MRKAPAHFAPNFWDHPKILGIFWDFLGLVWGHPNPIPKNPKKSQEFLDEIFHRKNSGIFWDGSQKIPKNPKFFGVIWDESQKNWDHPKKIGVILGWFGGDTRGSETVTRKQEKTFIYVTVTE